MNADSKRINSYVEAYNSGIYTKDETIGAIIDVLKNFPENSSLWADIPNWGQKAIWEFLKGCDTSTQLYDVSTSSNDVIAPGLIALKNWLAQEKNYK